MKYSILPLFFLSLFFIPNMEATNPMSKNIASSANFKSMSFFKKLFSKKDDPIKNYADFWTWFQENEKQFHKVIEAHDRIEPDFLDKISPKLGELKEGFFFLTGMKDDETAEVIFTADANPKNIVFVEELVAAAPKIDGWLFTCLKQPSEIEGTGIRMAGYEFTSENLSFYENDNKELPDEINITIVHQDYKEEDRDRIVNGIYIFLDNYLGELNFVTTIDELNFKGPNDPENKDLVPITKLPDFLKWRQKEFIEKYEGVWHDTENDNYTLLEATMKKSGNPVLAAFNKDVLEWDRKASHPWVMLVKIKYDGSDYNGLPNDESLESLNALEEELMAELKDEDGYLNIGRQSAENLRTIFFACKDFRKPSKVAFDLENKYEGEWEVSSEIYKDKYWQTFEMFRQ